MAATSLLSLEIRPRSSLCSPGEISVSGSMSVWASPTTDVRGVRSSWLTLAMKRSFSVWTAERCARACSSSADVEDRLSAVGRRQSSCG